MIFLYSRKMQIGLLLIWLAGMALMYAQIDRERSSGPDLEVEAILGHMPEMPALPTEPETPAEPQPDPRPAADPVLNRCLDLRVEQSGEKADTLVLELDYVAAQTGGFALEKAHGYHYADAPVFVVALGEPWISDIGNVSFPGPIPEVSDVNLVVSKSQNMRLLINTKSMRTARGAKLSLSPADAGMRVEIHLPR
jgi:hypothetical protein